VSHISDSERGHLRGISETSVSTDGRGERSNYATPMEESTGAGVGTFGPGAQGGLGLGNSLGRATVPPNVRPNVVSPLTPPEGGEETDYLTAGGHRRSGQSGRRKSNFAEGLDEVSK